MAPNQDLSTAKQLDEAQRKAVSEQEAKLTYIALIIITLLATGTVVVHYLENWGWIDSLYFSTVTLTTVGYGDFVPTHQLTRVFIILYILGGVSTLLYGLTAISKYYVDRREYKFYHNLVSRGKPDLPHPRDVLPTPKKLINRLRR